MRLPPTITKYPAEFKVFRSSDEEVVFECEASGNPEPQSVTLYKIALIIYTFIYSFVYVSLYTFEVVGKKTVPLSIIEVPAIRKRRMKCTGHLLRM